MACLEKTKNAVLGGYGGSRLKKYINPIIGGFNPDPSICKAELYFMGNVPGVVRMFRK